MIIRLSREDIPYTLRIAFLVVSVADNKALTSVGLFALELAVYRIQAGHDVYHAVVRQPRSVDINAAGSIFVIILTNHRGKGLKQRKHG